MIIPSLEAFPFYEFIEFFMSYGAEVIFLKNLLYKMENNHETLRMPELKALTQGSGFRGYSRLRKPELIAFLWDNEQR